MGEEIRIAGGDHGDIIDGDRILGAQTQNQTAHRQAMVMMRLHLAAAGYWSAMDGEAVRPRLDHDTIIGQKVGRAGEGDEGLLVAWSPDREIVTKPATVQRRIMSRDVSWAEPAAEYIEIYRRLVG